MLDSSKLKEFLDTNFKFDENGRKLSKGVENTVRKEEIVCYGRQGRKCLGKGKKNERFFFLHSCESPFCFFDALIDDKC